MPATSAQAVPARAVASGQWVRWRTSTGRRAPARWDAGRVAAVTPQPPTLCFPAGSVVLHLTDGRDVSFRPADPIHPA